MNSHMEATDKTQSDTFKGINPLTAPALYSRHFGAKREDTITTVNRDGQLMKLEMLSHLDDPKSGFYGDVMIDKATGHAIILYKGMDVPLRNEGNGRTGFLRDAFVAAQTWFTGARNMQTPFAEKLYLDTRKNPDVKSVEVIGFSLGTLHANYIAAKYGVPATVLADLGIGDKGLRSIFNKSAANDAEIAEKNLKNNLTVLRMGMDMVPLFGAGPHRGTVIDLDTGRAPDASGITHLASIYNKKAQNILAEPAPRPAPVAADSLQTTVLKTIEKSQLQFTGMAI